ncbi:hypothetical protein HanXRQr2_Chr13g0604131 [Helianthus annuus]|uniref:Uncharacterized protein n=1 Tax=Helianthus annuus TaxID=4232 RepID=A0A251SVP7_HELAN|nr:hypothetical protein HanXRQr2_Chr13g0604131 [Helianthus annuus]KAJ0850552.1 hypothetical protein HanPSC8_Chr13g0582141 [Helianthus annuus]
MITRISVCSLSLSIIKPKKKKSISFSRLDLKTWTTLWKATQTVDNDQRYGRQHRRGQRPALWKATQTWTTTRVSINLESTCVSGLTILGYLEKTC